MTIPKGLTDAALLFHRSLGEGRRDPGPAYVLPAMPPLLMVVVFTALFERIAETPGFGAGDYTDYLLPGAVVLTALLGAGFTATYLVQDAVGGYLDRLRLLPTSRGAMLGGRQAFEAVRVLPAAIVVTAVCVALGARIDGGVAGVAACLLLVALLSAAFSGLFHVAGLVSRDPQTALALQPIGVLVGLVSTALVPASVAASGLSDVARLNPASVVVDGARASLAGDVLSSHVAFALAICTAGIVLTQLAVARQLARA
ncbi:MAG: ABC transporter permease [Solirubrobacteraceae bacterium]